MITQSPLYFFERCKMSRTYRYLRGNNKHLYSYNFDINKHKARSIIIFLQNVLSHYYSSEGLRATTRQITALESRINNYYSFFNSDIELRKMFALVHSDKKKNCTKNKPNSKYITQFVQRPYRKYSNTKVRSLIKYGCNLDLLEENDLLIKNKPYLPYWD